MKERIIWIDGLRIGGSLAVIFLHVWAAGVMEDPVAREQHWRTANWCGSFARWGVLVFIMIGGAMLLPHAHTLSVGAFYRKRLTRLAIPTAFWTIVYVFWSANGMPNISNVGKKLLTGAPYYHLWFVYMLLGLYLFAPFLSRFLNAVDRHTTLLAVIIGMILYACHGIMLIMKNVYPSDVFSMWLPYVPYFLLGPLLFAGSSQRFRWVGLTLFFGGCITTALATEALKPILDMGERHEGRTMRLFHNRLNPLLISASIGLVLAVRGITFGATVNTIIRRLAVYMPGVYLIHPIFIETLLQIIPLAKYEHLVIRSVLFTFAIFASALGSCALIAFVPGGRRIVC